MLINVTREDIEKGVHGDPASCMIALALERQMDIPQGKFVAVGYGDIDLVDHPYKMTNLVRIGTISSRTVRKMWLWDLGNEIEPFKCIVQLDEGSDN